MLSENKNGSDISNSGPSFSSKEPKELPTPDEVPEIHELHIFDRTGKLVKIEKCTVVNLVDDLRIRVKSSDMHIWQEEIDKVKTLTKQQGEIFKTVIKGETARKNLSPAVIAFLVEHLKKETSESKHKQRRFRQSGHFVEQKLKYQKPNQKAAAPPLSEPDGACVTTESTQTVIRVEGIKLTEPESKLEMALTKLLGELSPKKSPFDEDYYSGNEKPQLVNYGDKKRRAPCVRFTRGELYRAYLGKDKYSGADAEFIDKLLIQFASKPFYVKYDRIQKGKDGKSLTDRIEFFQPLIKLIYFYPNLTEEEKTKLDNGDVDFRKKREEIVVLYSPIFIDQIGEKFVEFPEDINRQLIIAAGGHSSVTISMRKLMEFCLQRQSAKTYHPEINEENLASMLGLEKYVQQNRKKLLKERIAQAINVIKQIGIIIEAERLQNSTDGFKWKFTLNTKYK
jgi:hypothetical protein